MDSDQYLEGAPIILYSNPTQNGKTKKCRTSKRKHISAHSYVGERKEDRLHLARGYDL